MITIEQVDNVTDKMPKVFNPLKIISYFCNYKSYFHIFSQSNCDFSICSSIFPKAKKHYLSTNITNK